MTELELARAPAVGVRHVPAASVGLENKDAASTRVMAFIEEFVRMIQWTWKSKGIGLGYK